MDTDIRVVRWGNDDQVTENQQQGISVAFAVLGPLSVSAGSVDLTPKAQMPARLLALLLLYANQMVSVNTIVDELWDVPPRLAKKAVHTYVYQLRKQLGAVNPATGGELIETHQRGYLLRITEGQLDLHNFYRFARIGAAALAEADHAAASGAFQRALDLWRGPMVSGLEIGPLLAAERATVEDRRLDALERRIDADLGLGRHRALLSELKGLVQKYPTHEGFCSQLMTAASQVGRRDEALAAYQQLRRAVAAELGLDPSERLKELHQRILRSSSVPEPRSELERATPRDRGPAQLPIDTADFVGRAQELRLLAGLNAHSARQAVASLALVVGQLGVGKTTLAVHAAHRDKARFPDGQLFASLHNRDSLPVPPEEVLAQFLRALAVPDYAIPAALDERAGLFRTLIAGRRILVVLDDAASTDQVAPLLPAGPDAAAVITATRRLPGLPGLRTADLAPMTVNEGNELLGNIVGVERIGREPEASRDVVRLCDQLPLAVRAAGERLVACCTWPIGTLAERLSDERRRLAELRRGGLNIDRPFERAVRRLSIGERSTLATLCRLDTPGRFGLRTAAVALGVEALEAERLVGALLSAQLLTVAQHGRRPCEVRFSIPDLIRLYVLQHTAPGMERSGRLDGAPGHFHCSDYVRLANGING